MSENAPDEHEKSASSTCKTSQVHIPGIDITKAMAVLSERSRLSTNGGNRAQDGEGCPCCLGTAIPERARKMGQRIDLSDQLKTTGNSAAEGNQSPLNADLQQMQNKRESRLTQIKQELNSMADIELLQAVLRTQQDRVATYRTFESALVIVLQTGNITTYPDACSRATAAFSVASDTIKIIQSILQARNRTELSNLIGQLQSHEQQKLQLTAAHHLERIRQNDHSMSDHSSITDSRTANLLHQGVLELQNRIHHRVQSINEVIDEIRCAIMDEQ